MVGGPEPKPAELPLAGGREGATVRLRPMLSGQGTGPPGWFLREQGRLSTLKALGIGVPGGSYLEVPVVAFWVEHPEAGGFLIDTGFHSSVAEDPKESLGQLNARALGHIEMRPEDAVSSQLQGLGVQPEEVGLVVMTHLHMDHASGIPEFPNATFVMSAAEWQAAHRQGPLHGYVRGQYDQPFEYRTLDFEAADVDSYSTFGRSFDLFGDGSVRLVYTPGHTLGHLSVVLRLRGREALVAGDAIYTMRTLTHAHLPYRMADRHLFSRSLREIQLYAREAPEAVVIPGHDMKHWRTLEPVYE
jgi:N-acyl homoserine lactone hydrolase